MSQFFDETAQGSGFRCIVTGGGLGIGCITAIADAKEDTKAFQTLSDSVDRQALSFTIEKSFETMLTWRAKRVQR
jgi:hypothetical protein